MTSVMLTKSQAQGVADRTGTALISVMRRLLGWPVRGRAGQRIDAALAAWPASPPAFVAKVLP
jgi:hypothetical protein